ncbi:MAG: hypothetical protein L3J00_02160 [Thiomicrorhabdus sp.]|nr:hypothetical protein [Thiomicrorhabdus sp.]
MSRTFIDNKGVRWIIDYKTSVFEKTKGGRENRTQAAFIDHQVTQYQPQLQCYGTLFESLENRPQQWVLYFTYLDCWVVVEE